MSKARCAVVAAGVLLVIAAGCSGSDESNDGTGPLATSDETATVSPGMPVPDGGPSVDDLLPPVEGETDETLTPEGGVGLPVDAVAWFESCADAVIAGAAPLTEGEPGYRDELDPDGDGVACGRRPIED